MLSGQGKGAPPLTSSFSVAATPRELQSPAADLTAPLHQLARLRGTFHPHRNVEVFEESEDTQPLTCWAHCGPLQVCQGGAGPLQAETKAGLEGGAGGVAWWDWAWLTG